MYAVLILSILPPVLTDCRSQSTLAVIRHSLRTEGAMFAFKGWVPAWMRLQPTTILIFLILEQLKNGVDWQRGKSWAFI